MVQEISKENLSAHTNIALGLLCILGAIIVGVSMTHSVRSSGVEKQTGRGGQFSYLLPGSVSTRSLMIVMGVGGLLSGISYMIPRIMDNNNE